MNKRAEGILEDNLVYTFLFLIFLMFMFYFVIGYQDGATYWEDFYAKEISRIIDKAETGTEITLDITKLAIIAIKNEKKYTDIISVDNVNNEISVSTRKGTKTSFKFYKDLDIVDPRIEIPSGSATSTRFIFKLKERANNAKI